MRGLGDDAVTPEVVDGVPVEAQLDRPESLESSPWRLAGASLLATVGVLPVKALETSQTPLPTLAGNLAGTAAGGALVGYMAGGGRGAFTAALFTSGLAGLLNASILLRRDEHRPLGGLVGALSVISLLGSWYLASRRES